MTDLHDAVKQCVERPERFRRNSQRVGEQNTMKEIRRRPAHGIVRA